MGYRLPTFNLMCRIWRQTTWNAAYPPGPIPPPDVTSACNLTYGEKTSLAGIANTMYLLLPKGTDVRDGFKEQIGVGGNDVVEVPSGSGEYYLVSDVGDVGKGFPNEYRCASIFTILNGIGGVQLPAWPVPYP